MLVLTRALGEVIQIGETTVKVVRVRGGKVRLGIDAPADVAVTRAELCPAGSAAQARSAGPVQGEAR